MSVLMGVERGSVDRVSSIDYVICEDIRNHDKGKLYWVEARRIY